MTSVFDLDFKVRDYECDLQGIVNNANYQHYLEHTRHEFLLANNLSFAELHKQGIDLVVVRVDIAYKNSLHSGDKFVSRLNFKKEGLKYTFYQTIHHLPDMKLCVRARVDNVAVMNGRLTKCKILDEFVEKISKKYNLL